VVELVAGIVAQPEPPAADVVPAHREERPVRDREQRRPVRCDEILAVVPFSGDVRPEGTERVPEGGGPEDREDVAATRESRGDLGCRLDNLGWRTRNRAP